MGNASYRADMEASSEIMSVISDSLFESPNELNFYDIVALNSNEYIVMYLQWGENKCYARLITVFNEVVTVGETIEVEDNISYYFKGTRLNNSSALFGYSDSYDSVFRFRILSVSNGVLSVGSAYDNGSTRPSDDWSIESIDETKVVCAMETNRYCFVVEINNGVITFGAYYTYASTAVNNVDLSIVDSSKFVVIYSSLSTYKLYAVICTVSGNVITINTPVEVASSSQYKPTVQYLGNGYGVVFYLRSWLLYAKVMTISGVTITLGSEVAYTGLGSGTTFSLYNSIKIDETTGVITCTEFASSPYGGYLIYYYLNNGSLSFSGNNEAIEIQATHGGSYEIAVSSADGGNTIMCLSWNDGIFNLVYSLLYRPAGEMIFKRIRNMKHKLLDFIRKNKVQHKLKKDDVGILSMGYREHDSWASYTPNFTINTNLNGNLIVANNNTRGRFYIITRFDKQYVWNNNIAVMYTFRIVNYQNLYMLFSHGGFDVDLDYKSMTQFPDNGSANYLTVDDHYVSQGVAANFSIYNTAGLDLKNGDDYFNGWNTGAWRDWDYNEVDFSELNGNVISHMFDLAFGRASYSKFLTLEISEYKIINRVTSEVLHTVNFTNDMIPEQIGTDNDYGSLKVSDEITIEWQRINL